MQFVKGPDFPTGGLVYRHINGSEDGEDSLVSAYATGRGKITMRAKMHIEDMGRGKQRIIVSELPYQTNKSALVERIASLVRDGRLEGIADLRDETDRQGLRLAIELQRGIEADAGHREAVQADAAARDLQHHHAGAGQQRAARPQPEAVSQNLSRSPARSGAAAQRIRTRPRPRARPHPRRACSRRSTRSTR